jgi:hypothetical protein
MQSWHGYLKTERYKWPGTDPVPTELVQVVEDITIDITNYLFTYLCMYLYVCGK